MELNNQATIITGGASGMGAATAKLLASQGAKVTILDRDIAAAHLIAKAINGLAIACDITSAEAVANAIAEAKSKHGVARICINCAGIAPAQRVVSKNGVMSLEAFAEVIQINLIGTFNVLRLVAQDMCEASPVNADNERGVIINTASIAAYEGQIGQSAYSASKGGIVGMTLPLAREFTGRGIRVMAIAPGVMHTPMISKMPQAVQEALAAQVPFPKRLGFAEEYAALAKHIVENPYLNGSVIRLDGAMRMTEK